MDIYCPKCAEPYDFDSFESPGERRAFTREGCTAVPWIADHWCGWCGSSWGVCTDPETHRRRDGERAGLARAVYELMGDDIDGAAGAFDDAQVLGLI